MKICKEVNQQRTNQHSTYLKDEQNQLGTVMNTYNPRYSQEVEAGGY
jgi:hypothetical protein